jgi:hypothetical protein
MVNEKKISDEQVDEIISDLVGTCDTLNDAITATTGDDNLTEDDLLPEQLEHIDNEIFLCTDCGWWCEMIEEVGSLINGEMGCSDCNPEDED